MDINELKPLQEKEKRFSQAAAQMPDEVYRERHEELREVLGQQLYKISLERYNIELTQPFKIKIGPGEFEKQVQYSKDAKLYLEELDKIEKMLVESAQRRFFRGYEHLMPDDLLIG